MALELTSTLKIGSAIQASVVVVVEEEGEEEVVVEVPAGIIKKIPRKVKRATKVQVAKARVKVTLDKI